MSRIGATKASDAIGRRHDGAPGRWRGCREMLVLQTMLQRFADADVADDVFALAMKRVQRGFGFFCRAVFQLGKFEAAFAT